MRANELQNPPSLSDHCRGFLHAPVVILEYADFECPKSRALNLALKQLSQEYSEEVCIVFRHFPDTVEHPQSGFAAMAAEAAAVQGKFWEMHDALFEQRLSLTSERIFDIGRTIGMDMRKFLDDLERDDLLERVHQNYEAGLDNDISETPVIFINGLKAKGYPDFEVLKMAVERKLRETQVLNDHRK